MNVTDFTYLLQHPEEVVSPEQTHQLEDVLKEYPYFQAARSLHLKGLKNGNSFKYNNALKVTAAYTTDREILFDFITSPEFFQNRIADTISGKTAPLTDTATISEEIIASPKTESNLIETSEDNPLPQNLEDAEHILDPSLFQSKDPKVNDAIFTAKKKTEKQLEIGTPLQFTKKEKYSFNEWSQLTASKKGDITDKVAATKNKKAQENKTKEQKSDKTKKFELIDRFIENNPKIVPQEKFSSTIDLKESSQWDKHELMTETLAKVYLEQRNFKKAIQSYKILSLKYPEKSSFFADRIKEIEKIQQKND